MAEKTTIARPYATAVFELARETPDGLKQWSERLALLRQVVADPGLQSLLDDPRINAAALADLIMGVCGNLLDAAGRRLVETLAESGRLSLAAEIAALYEQLRQEAESVVEVEVTSAFPLEQDEQEKINGMLAGRYQQKLSISAHVDASLIGGVIIRVGDSVIDASIKGKLRQLGNHLAG